jgi:hypothetical protein
MASRKSNTFRKAIRHLKSNQIDEKLQLLNEIPTNNTSGIYTIEPESEVQDPDIPGEVSREADFNQDVLENGRDTTGLFDDNGIILTIEPPEDTSYILGPMSSMWYAWGNFTTIGYIRQSDRRMVDLGRITGQLGSWSGTSGFVSYGQLTISQAVWFRDTPKLNGADNNTPNYRAFYPGPPSNSPDQYGRYLCVITGTSKPTSFTPPPRKVPPTMGGFDPNLPPGSANPNNNKKLDDYIKSLPPEIQNQVIDNKTNDLINDLLLLGISAAITKVLIPALISGATPTLDRLKYLAKLRVDRGALNPFGQTAVRSGAAGRQRVDVYSGRPYQGPRGNRTGTQYGTINKQTANTYTNPGKLRGLPGTGSQTNPRGTLDSGNLPQRYIDKYGSRSVLGQQQVKLSPRSARRTFGESLEYVCESKKNKYADAFIEKLFSEDPNPYEKIDGLIKSIEKYLTAKNNNVEENYKNRKRILREIKKPYVLPEEPKVKFKHKPKVNRTINPDLMKKSEVPSSFKKPEERMWGKYEKDQNARLSQERKNEVLDHLGGSDHFWEYMTETSRKKNKDIQYTNFGDKKIVRKEELKGDTLLFLVDETGKKENILQSEFSICLANEFNKELFEKYFQEQETLQADKDPLFKRVSKRLKKEIDYPDKPAKNGYPNDPPPKMINGWHPEYGKDKGYYNKLDPHSAESMPNTGNSEIDKKVVKARKQLK